MFETTEIEEAATGAGVLSALTGRRIKVRLIEGDRLGSSGYYPAEVLAKDGPRLFTKGTPMFLNHQTPQEKTLRPFGAIQDYAAELAEDAYYENDGLYAEVEVFEDMAPLIKNRMNKIGVSIRAKAVTETQVINGKKVPVVKELLEARSADFVMKAGAGGKIVSILESATEETETDSETTTESEESMAEKEVLDAISGLGTKLDSLVTTLEEALKPKPEVEAKPEVEESAVDEAKIEEIAEAFVASNLDAAGRKRVLDLHKATKTPIAELIEAEEQYLKEHGAKVETVEGVEESAEETEVEESAKGKVTVPTLSIWKKKA